MSLRVIFILLLTLAVFIFPVFSDIKIGGIFSITGPAANLGAPEAKTVEMLVEQINAKGGIKGQKIELIVKDSGGRPEKAMGFAKQLIEEEKVIAIIGPSTSGESIKLKQFCEDAKVILISCAAAEVIVDPIAKYVFKTAQKDCDAAKKIYGVMKKLGIKSIGVIASNTGFGNTGKEQLEKYNKEFGIDILISEGYNPSATDLTELLNKLKAKNVQAVVNWSIEPVQSIVAKDMKQIGLNVPLFQSHGFGNINYVKAAGAAAEGIIFPCSRVLIADILPATNKQKTVLVNYKKDYEEKYKGEDVNSFGGYAYDAFMILVKAIEKAGTDKEKVRAAIENTKGFVGVSGIFNFSAKDHTGLGIDSFETLIVKNGAFAIYSK